jgi:hypothetical protein
MNGMYIRQINPPAGGSNLSIYKDKKLDETLVEKTVPLIQTE